MSEAKFKVYGTAFCLSPRSELAEINGLSVGIIGRTRADDGSWTYTVSPDDKRSKFYTCAETELAAAPRVLPPADDRYRDIFPVPIRLARMERETVS